MCIFSGSTTIERLDHPQQYTCPMCHAQASVILTRKISSIALCGMPLGSPKAGGPVWRCTACPWAGPVVDGAATAAVAAAQAKGVAPKTPQPAQGTDPRNAAPSAGAPLVLQDDAYAVGV
ncbi:hypothetical protein AMAG_03302 [Allomyces macrogynus ATCC 38327]|uniref:Uncharacterized protein n=1 Tax=Allomyces macrogynus (strain ATCC 38327) TaxID=578462 RepID=A0A0L0S501_ALLM3|nr:hypothetical protein AMAG_03302 [Allomyces macrogynus ATCC 38327]|eukprot:KNE57613.1 hypothetical protein AMAG_03302 [Allomyces macrogynus ATCC 38327]